MPSSIGSRVSAIRAPFAEGGSYDLARSQLAVCRFGALALRAHTEHLSRATEIQVVRLAAPHRVGQCDVHDRRECHVVGHVHALSATAPRTHLLASRA